MAEKRVQGKTEVSLQDSFNVVYTIISGRKESLLFYITRKGDNIYLQLIVYIYFKAEIFVKH